MGIEPRPLVWEGNILLDESLQASTTRSLTTPLGGELTYLAPGCDLDENDHTLHAYTHNSHRHIR